MLTRFRNWLKNEKQWNKDHVESWKNMTEIQENNLTKFQNICFEQLTSSFFEKKITITEIKIKKLNGNKKENENYIYGILPNSNSQIYIYEDGVEIEGQINNEKWDFKTPNEMILNFVALAIELESTQQNSVTHDL